MIISFCETLKNLSRNFKDSSKSWTNHIQMMLILALIRGSNSAFLASITCHWFNEVKNQGEPFLLNMHSAVKHLPIFWNNVNEFFFKLQGVLAHRVFVKLLSCICKWIGLRAFKWAAIHYHRSRGCKNVTRHKIGVLKNI